MSLHIFMVGNCWISSLQGSPGAREEMWVEWCGQKRTERKVETDLAGWVLKMARMLKEQWESKWRDGRRKTCRGRDVCISEKGESSGGIANGLVCRNGWCLIAAEMDSTLQVLTECDTSGTWPQKEQIIALVWSGAWDSLQQMSEMCRLGVNEIERGRGVL